MEDYKFKFSDLAIILPLGGILLYSLGFIFWSTCYSNLNIDMDFIDLTIDRVISTTWELLVILLGLWIILHVILNKTKKYIIEDKTKMDIIIKANPILTTLVFIISLSVLIIAVYYLVSSIKSIKEIKVIIIAFLIILCSFLSNIKIKFFNKNQLLVVSFVIIYLSAFAMYRQGGEDTSQSLINNYSEDVMITTKDGKKFNGEFIGNLKHTYFILVKNKSIYETYGINADEVTTIKPHHQYLFKYKK